MDYIIIVAGGKGLRMGSEIPKQFMSVGGKPILMRTIERFREYSEALNIIVVLLLSGLIARETKHYVWDKNLDETDDTPIPVLESK